MTKVTQAHIDARTEAILSAAGKMFVRKGVDAATMQEIAAEAGLSAGAIYRYFPSKEELLREVCNGAVEHFREMFDHAVASTDSPLQALEDIGRAAWGELRRSECREDIILNLEAMLAAARQVGELATLSREKLTAVIDMLEGLIRQAQTEGEVETRVDARALAVTFLACHVGTGILALQLEGDVDTDAVYASLIEMTQRLAPAAI